MKVHNSVILSFYMFIASIYYMFNDTVRIVFFGISLGISLYMSVKVENSNSVLKVPVRLFRLFICIFIFTLFVQVINDTFTPLILYYLSSPLVAYFVYKNKFNTKILQVPFYVFSSYILIYFYFRRNLTGVLNLVSENYISIIIIMNISTIYIIKYIQKEKMPILPVIIGLFLSILAKGRSGIITVLFLLMLVVWLKWKEQGVLRKIVTFLMFFIPVIVVVRLKWSMLLNAFEKMQFFEKFSKSGVDSPSRNIIKEAYLSNINNITFFTGYNYENNYWFQYYGLNPHNSFIRLHYFSGFAFFIIIFLLLISFFNLIKKNLFFAGLLITILLRSWTDSVIFLTLFDYVLILLTIVAFNDKRRVKQIN